MRLHTSNENIISSYGLVAIPLVALITFVVGYTASRAHLGRTQDRNLSEEYNVVIPHQAVMWSEFAE